MTCVLISTGSVLHVTWNYDWWVCTLYEERSDPRDWHFEGLGTSYRLHVTWKCILHTHQITKCTKVQVKVHQEKLYTYNCHLLSIFCSTFPLLKLVFQSRCIWNWNLAHEPEFVKEGLYIWAWFGWLVRRAYKAGRGAYKPLLWASHCATNGGGHISIVPPTGWSPPTILPFTALSSPYCSAVQQQHILGVSLFKIEYASQNLICNLLL